MFVKCGSNWLALIVPVLFYLSTEPKNVLVRNSLLIL